MKKCIYCEGKKVDKISKDTYYCRSCDDEFSEEDITVSKGSKSKTKVKFTGKRV